MMEGLDQFKKVFFEECQDLLATAESHLGLLKNNTYTVDDVHAIFRCVHSIKGGAGSFGLDSLVEYAHVLETFLDQLRNEKITLTDEVASLLLRANDTLADFVSFAENDSDEVPFFAAEIQNRLREHLDSKKSGKTKKTKKEEVEKQLYHYEISFIPFKDMMQFGNDPLLILRDLKKQSLEDTYKVDAILDDFPDLLDFKARDCYLKWNISLQSYASEKQIREAFEFVEDDCKIDMTMIALNSNGDVEQKPVIAESDDVFLKAEEQKAQVTKGSDSFVQSIRVDLERIDRLVNTVGEMVIKQAMILDQASTLDLGGNHLLVKGLQELTQYTRELQESVMAIRAQPVKAVFSRIPRLVRDLSVELGKDIHVITIGENTEIDKTVIEHLGEPLTHMIRNAVDHGIELPAERIAANKPAQGTIKMLAEHRSGRIVIELIDDGRGIDRQKVLKKALEKSLVTEEQANTMTGEEIDQLVFLPGFSTASLVTNISGRGVGMDVVKKSIQGLGGRISIVSTEGQGCKFVLTLPLTLAVLDGMIVLCGDQHYILPLISIIETLRPTRDQITTFVGCHDILHLRDENIPLVYLYKVFDIETTVQKAIDGIVVVVETEGGDHIGIVVDDLLNQQQVVIKSLEANYDPIPGISAATILGNGRVALILDVSALKNIEMNNAKNIDELKFLSRIEGE
ncbi:MAG: chemotaxis protein CheA [Proteobacteria bacterium]|nr:chemotaxis protein CheA [Pseudomonadota bacterium]